MVGKIHSPTSEVTQCGLWPGAPYSPNLPKSGKIPQAPTKTPPTMIAFWGIPNAIHLGNLEVQDWFWKVIIRTYGSSHTHKIR